MMWKIQQANQDDAILAAKFTLLSSFNHAEVCIRQNFPACLPRSLTEKQRSWELSQPAL